MPDNLLPGALSTEIDGIERRAFQVTEFRAEGGGDKPLIIHGHAAVFNSPADSGWGWLEQVAPGAFTRAIKEDDVRALKNHNPDLILGRTKSKTLRLSEDTKGLYFEVEVPDTSYAADLVTSMRRGDIDQMSFAFRARKTQWDFDQDPPLRTLIDVRLFDVSPVTYPFYPDTDAQVRGILAAAMDVDADRMADFLTRARRSLTQVGGGPEALQAAIDAVAKRKAPATRSDDGLWRLDILRRKLALSERD